MQDNLDQAKRPRSASAFPCEGGVRGEYSFPCEGGVRGEYSCETPENASQPMLLQATVVAKESQGLLCIPSHLLGRLWPDSRVLLGLKISQEVRRTLLTSGGSVLLVKKYGVQIRDVDMAKELSRMSHLYVALQWRGGLKTLTSANSLNGAGRLAEVLGKCTAPALTQLDLGGNWIADPGAGRFWEVLGVCAVLAHLDLNRSQLRYEGASCLAGVLGGLTALTHLNLSCNQIGDGGVGRLAPGLGNCTALAHLDLVENSIGAMGAYCLAPTLVKCTALTHLDLSYNEVGRGEGGAGTLAGALGECSRLAHLYISFNSIQTDGAEKLAGLLGKCVALAHLDLRDVPEETSPTSIMATRTSIAGALVACEGVVHVEMNSEQLSATMLRVLQGVRAERAKVLHARRGGSETPSTRARAATEEAQPTLPTAAAVCAAVAADPDMCVKKLIEKFEVRRMGEEQQGQFLAMLKDLVIKTGSRISDHEGPFANERIIRLKTKPKPKLGRTEGAQITLPTAAAVCAAVAADPDMCVKKLIEKFEVLRMGEEQQGQFLAILKDLIVKTDRRITGREGPYKNEFIIMLNSKVEETQMLEEGLSGQVCQL